MHRAMLANCEQIVKATQPVLPLRLDKVTALSLLTARSMLNHPMARSARFAITQSPNHLIYLVIR
jgi:hypothetical protein